MDIILPGLAKTLRDIRKAHKRTQKEMAELLGCTERHYQKIEYGKVNLPSTMLIALADYFNVTTDYLLGREER